MRKTPLKLLQYCTTLLRRFLNNLFGRAKTNKLLSSVVGKEEELARNLIGGSSRKSIKKIYNPNTDEIKPSQFLDTRYPTELSVNRISTLTDAIAHELGLQLKDEMNSGNTEQLKIYHGFGKLTAQICLDAGCLSIEKEDYKGKKPYHANIIYPAKEKFEEMEIAIILAFKSELIKYAT